MTSKTIQEKKQINDRMNAFERGIKRCFDLLAATIGMIVLSPLFLICYVAVRSGHDGPVIFRQERIGKGSRPFIIYKFRTMVPHAETQGPQLCNPQGDQRLTKAGVWLRRWHLDELPQLWNVAKGDMSLVGPRPERAYFIQKIMATDSRYELLYQIRPGITSRAALYNGYTDTPEKMFRRLEMDLHYMVTRSWWEDLKIIMLTIFRTISGAQN